MRPIRVFSIFCAAVLAAGALAGCASPAASETKTATPQNADDTDTIYAQVQTIDDGVVTALVGTLVTPGTPDDGERPESIPGQAPGAANGDSQAAPPEGADGDSQAAPPEGADGDSQAAPPERPADGKDSAMQPSPGAQGGGMAGGRPQGDPAGGLPGGFLAGTETIVFTIDADTVITLANGGAGTIGDISAGDVLALTLANGVAKTVLLRRSGGDFGSFGANGAPGANGGGGDVENGTSANTIGFDTAVTGETYFSDGDDENALRVDGAAVTLENITVNKSGGASSNTENGDFYGMNAGLLAQNGATVTIVNAAITTNAVNGNGVFSYGGETTINIADSSIRTAKNNSGGIQTTGGATMNATNLDVETEGASSAAIRSDRGGGDVNVSGGVFVTNGTGSPAIYSTADIAAEHASLTANASEAVVVEGKNAVTLSDCALYGNMQASADSGENVHNIMLYQSMSGDAEVGRSSFTAVGGSIVAGAGDLFYVTNTTCVISLTNVALTLANGTLLNVAGNTSARGWGKAGANGGTCAFAAARETLLGDIVIDAISSLDFTLTDGSAFTGAINHSGDAGTVRVTLGDGCVWTLTGDSYISSFTGDAASVVTNGHTLYVGGVAFAA